MHNRLNSLFCHDVLSQKVYKYFSYFSLLIFAYDALAPIPHFSSKGKSVWCVCCDVSWSCKASKENKQRARMVVKVRVQVIIGWVCGIGECAGISLSEIRLANMCVDMSLPMHFNKFMVAIKQIVTTFLCVCVVFSACFCVWFTTLSEHVSRSPKKMNFCGLCQMLIYFTMTKCLDTSFYFPFFLCARSLDRHFAKEHQIEIKNRLPYGFYTHFPVVS